MFRQSIHENNERYSEAVKKVIELKKEGIEHREIPDKLSAYYQEKEIKKLLIDFEKLHTLKNDSHLKLVLKFSLWIVLLLKIFSLTIMLATLEIAGHWKLIILLFSILVFATALYLTYKDSFEMVFIILFGALLLSIDSLFDNFEVIFTTPAINFSWWITFIFTAGYIVSLYSSWRLRNIYKSHLFKLNKVINTDFPDYIIKTL